MTTRNRLSTLHVDAGKLDESTAAFVRRAETEGLIDVAYDVMDSPVGRLALAATPRGLVQIAFLLRPVEEALSSLSRRVSPRILHAPRRLAGPRSQLEEYFDGRRTRFDLPLDLQLVRGFQAHVLRATRRIPYGRVASYRTVAARAGNERAVRAAGSALGANPIPIVIPCHRVLRSDGTLGGYGGGLDRKELLLDLERAGRAETETSG